MAGACPADELEDDRREDEGRERIADEPGRARPGSGREQHDADRERDAGRPEERPAERTQGGTSPGDERANAHEKYERDCRDTGGTPEECTIPEPTLADFSAGPMPFKEAARTALEVSTVFVALAAFMIAASFIGAEYSSGSIANWLTFVPRRGRVFWSKLLTVLGFAALLGAFAGALVLFAAAALARLYGSPIESVAELGAMGGRGVLAVIGFTVLGFCAALLTRHTAGAIGVLLGYAVIWFVRNGPLSSLAWAQRLTPWTPEASLAAIVEHGYTYSVPIEKVTPEGATIEWVERTVSLTYGAIYWSILITLVIIASLLIFGRRDVV